MTGIFGPQNANAALTLPNGSGKQRYGAQQTWVKDCSGPGRNDGTVLDGAFYNRIIGNLDYLVSQAGVTAVPGDFTVIYRAVLGAVAVGAPAALNSIKELADALGDNPNYAATVLQSLSFRVRVDAAQYFTAPQKAQAVVNLGLANVAVSGVFSDLTVDNPANARGSLGIKQAINLSASQDFNLVTTAGTYSTIDQTPSHAPTADHYYLVVQPFANDGVNYVRQTASNIFTGDQFTRVKSTGTWTAWRQVIQLDATTSKLPAVDGSLLTNLTVPWGSVSGKPTFATVATTGAYADLTGLPTLGTAASKNVGTGLGNVVQLDVTTGKLPAVDGSLLTGVTVTWTNVSGKPTFATVATTGVYADLTSKPTLGTAAALNVGTGLGNVVQLDASTGKLPAVDGSLLTGVISSGSGSVIYNATQSLTAPQQLQARTNINAAALTRTRTVITTGSGTYTLPTNCKAINVRMVGGGSGGGGGGSAGGGNGSNGSATTFGTSLLTASGGNGGVPGGGYTAGGAASGGDINAPGGAGGFGWGAGFGSATSVPGGPGGASAFGGGGGAGFPGAAGQAGQAPGSGGGGGGSPVGTGFGGAGGSAGGYCEKLIASPIASYSYVVGAAGGAGGAGTSGGAGGAGAVGLIIIDEFY